MYYVYVGDLINIQNMSKHKKGSGRRNYLVRRRKIMKDMPRNYM